MHPARASPGGRFQYTRLSAPHTPRVPDTVLLSGDIGTAGRFGTQRPIVPPTREHSRHLRPPVAPSSHRAVGLGLLISFGLLEWSAAMKSPELTSTFAADLYLSARALVTLNDGDPQNAAARFLSVCEGAPEGPNSPPPVRDDWSVRISDGDESPFAVSDPFRDSS
jgi:hypothetical protein